MLLGSLSYFDVLTKYENVRVIQKCFSIFYWYVIFLNVCKSLIELFLVEKGYVNKTEFKKLFDAQQTDADTQMRELKEAFSVFDTDNR